MAEQPMAEEQGRGPRSTVVSAAVLAVAAVGGILFFDWFSRWPCPLFAAVVAMLVAVFRILKREADAMG